jgi:hypothetical protein
MQFAAQESALAHVADSAPTRPSHGDIASLGQFQQALELVIPWHSQAAASKRYDRSVSGRSKREMRDPYLGFHHTGFDRTRWAKYFLTYPIWRNTQRDQEAIHVAEKSCGPAYVKVSLYRDAKSL